jgi:hypothetical protein
LKVPSQTYKIQQPSSPTCSSHLDAAFSTWGQRQLGKNSDKNTTQ